MTVISEPPPPLPTVPPPARETTSGCEYLKEWAFGASDPVPVTDYCGNPDDDPGGYWCFVVDEGCEGRNWGYCKASSCDSQSPYTKWQAFSDAHGNSCFKPEGPNR